MFPYADAHSRLDQHHQRVAEMARRAAEHRLARELSTGRHRRRFGRRPRRSEPHAPRVAVPA